MKRDMGLIREALLTVERGVTDDGITADLFGRRQRQQLDIAVDEGFAERTVVKNVGSDNAVLEWYSVCWSYALTWQGHEFLAMFRDDALWERVTSLLASVGIGESYEVMVEIVKQIAIWEHDHIEPIRCERKRDEDSCRIRDLEQQHDKDGDNISRLVAEIDKDSRMLIKQTVSIEDLRKKIQTLKGQGATDGA